VRAVPMWRFPVGLGAMRTRTDIEILKIKGLKLSPRRQFLFYQYARTDRHNIDISVGTIAPPLFI
jgi:hypothetical protein